MNEPRVRILVADDDLTARLLMQAALSKSSFDVVLAEDGTDALRQFNAHACDMVMLDVEMPGLNGYEVCARLRAEVGGELPIVMVTGMDNLESIERAFEAGATDFISKPINWPLIGHRVRYLFRSYLVLQDLNAANARNAAILNALPDTLLRLDGEGRILDVRLGGRAAVAAELPQRGQLLADSFPAEAAASILAAADSARDGSEGGGVDFKLSVAGSDRHYEARVADINGQETLCLLRDITERKEAEDRINRLAFFDPLTGLPNRMSFIERLEREVERASRTGGKLAVLFMDLDRFKNVNDTLGHGAGDLLLQQVADRLRKGVRPADMVSRDGDDVEIDLARLGGDEFTLLLPQLRQGENALTLARRIHELMHRPFILEGRQMVVTASIGIAVYPDDGHDAANLLKHADTAMYHAKEKGRDNCQFYSSSLTQEAMRRLDLEGALRQALTHNEFFLAFQPQLDLASGTVQSVEALLRWQRPDHGLVPPLEFIAVAEDNGLIVPIGEWVLRAACTQAKRWLDAGHPLRVGVNLSAVQFRNPKLVEQVRQVLDETGLPAQYLELEMTEGALMEDSEANLQTLKALRAFGLQFSLDDFGTGYSSLSYLKRLPLHNLKIDRSFVSGLPDDRESLAIVRAIVALAKSLGFTVTAEGIETVKQARILCNLGCEMLEGYFIGKPGAPAEIEAMLKQVWDIEGQGGVVSQGA